MHGWGDLVRVLIVVLAFVSLVSCAQVASKVAKAVVTSDVPKVSANVQAGRTNSQTAFGDTTNNDLKLERPKARKIIASQDETGVKADDVGTVVINEAQEGNLWRDAVLVLIPSPLGLLFWPLLLWLRRRLTQKQGGRSNGGQSK